MMLRLDNDIIPEADEIRLFAKVRNEANRLPFWTSYYRKLGVDRFFMIDNDSTDHTVELLSRDKDVHIFSTSEKMSMARAGMDWIEPLLHQYGQNRWCLIVDADELLVYPDSESVPLREFCQMLGQINADAFGCLLIDMYPAGNIHDVTYVPGQSFVDVCPFFDSSGYKCLWADRKGPSIVGGPRLSMSPLFEHLLEISKRAIDYSRVKARLLEGLESPLGFREEDYRIEAPSNAALDDADLQIVGDAISSKSTNCLLLSNGTDILHMKSMSRKRFLLARRRLKYLLAASDHLRHIDRTPFTRALDAGCDYRKVARRPEAIGLGLRPRPHALNELVELLADGVVVFGRYRARLGFSTGEMPQARKAVVIGARLLPIDVQHVVLGG